MRLIDADKLRKTAYTWLDGACLVLACKDVDEAPTIEAVPVVHCKDCKYYDRTEMRNCKFCGSDRFVENYDFCSDGKRIENDE